MLLAWLNPMRGADMLARLVGADHRRQVAMQPMQADGMSNAIDQLAGRGEAR